MKSKKWLMMGLLFVGFAASALATYQHMNSSSADCCTPGCCQGSQMPDCCKAAE
ncbi:MAG: hypothetical protein IT269_12730 [Saprospiraceae bacterium]|nr:hypothetical protein [Saprospiraceae bacterium]